MLDMEEEEALDPDPVFEWRRGQLVDAGLDTWDAGRIALSKADLHQVLDAIDAGCPLKLVTAIWL